jgi:hypothetical protein
MAKALKCDRCGGFYDLLTDFRNYRIQEVDTYEKHVDLCPDCYAKLLIFLDLDNPDKINKNREIIGTGELYPGEFESRHYEFEENEDGSSST